MDSIDVGSFADRLQREAPRLGSLIQLRFRRNVATQQNILYPGGSRKAGLLVFRIRVFRGLTLEMGSPRTGAANSGYRFPRFGGEFLYVGIDVVVRSGGADNDWRTGPLGDRVPPVTGVVGECVTPCR